VIRCGVHLSADVLARFRAEADAIARLNHPNIVQIYEVGECQGRPFFSLELVEGDTLAERAADAALPPREAAGLVEVLARAMHHAHERGLIHRDLKPENVLVSAEGTPKITDFGLVRFVDGAARLTQTRDFLGTPHYTPPEQACGQAHAAGPAADVYGLGAILYFLLAGQPPFLGASVLAILEQVRNSDPVRPRLLRPVCPRDLETICLKCLHKQPFKRYASAVDLAEDLKRFRQDRPIHARPVPGWERLFKACKRRPAMASLVGMFALLVPLLTVGLGVAQVREWQRLHGLRRGAEATVRDAEDAAQRKQWSEAGAHLDSVRTRTAGEPSLVDLADRAENLRTAYARFRQILQQHDKAMFQGVYLALFPAPNSTPPACPGELDEATASCLSEQQREEVAISRYEILLMRADVEARGRQTRRALDALDAAKPLCGETPAYHLRRAHYLGLLGANEERRRELARLQEAPPRSAFDHFLSGVHLYQQDDLLPAVRALETAVRLEPDHFWGEFFLAACHLRLRNWLAAEYLLSHCHRQRPGLLWTLLLRGFAEVELAKYTDAEEDFRLAESDLAGDPVTAANPSLDSQARAVLAAYRGILALRKNQLPQAEASFRAAIDHQPTLYQAHAGLLRVFVQQDRPSEADRQFATLAKLGPPAVIIADYHTLRARQLYRSRKDREAVAACDAALAAQAGHAEAFALRGQALLRLEDFGHAADSFDRYLQCGGAVDADVYRGRGQARMKLDRFLDAGYDYTRALELAPDVGGISVVAGLPGAVLLRGPEAELLTHRGWAWFFSNAFEPALRDFEASRCLRPDGSDAWVGGGLCKAALGREADAVVDAREALRLGVRGAEMLFNVACIFARAARKMRADPARSDGAAECRVQAIAHIRAALAMLRPQERSSFWIRRMRADPWLDAIRGSAEFIQLDKDCSGPPAKPPGAAGQ
jgi:tetratricopeptide (TPR) repeat protein